MKFLIKQNKKVAALLLLIMTTEIVAPNFAYALTSGPSQPETQGFQPIGNSDMVDLFSGDFSYNVPLMDVGGYPVNLAYHSGASMDDEASWVGYGWSLNTGSLNRQLRGLPDDFNGTDKQVREMSMKDHVVKGGKFSMTLDLLGIPLNKIKKKIKKKKKLNLSLTVSVGVKHDNYRGLGMELGANTGVSLTNYTAGSKTNQETEDPSRSDTTTSSIGGSLGLNLSSMDGAGLSLNADILRNKLGNDDKYHGLSSSVGFGYNSRAGLTGMTLGSSFSTLNSVKNTHGGYTFKKSFENNFYNSSISFNGNTYSPTIDHPTKNNSFTFSLHLGPEIFVVLLGLGVTGFYTKQTISQNVRSLPAYGYMNSEKGKNDNLALLDFNREKDIPYSKEVKYLPLPVPAYDLFTATSQDGSGQYRSYQGSSGVFFDHKTETSGNDFSLGIEVGGGTYFDVGADLYFQDLKTKTKKWVDRNYFLSKGDFQGPSSSTPTYEPTYFKRVGEPVPYDGNYVAKIKGTNPVAVSLPGKLANAVAGAEASDKLRTPTAINGESIPVLKRDKREVRNTTFSYLTAMEASNHGLDKVIKDYRPDSLVLNNCNSAGIKNNFSRKGGYRKSHHISEVTITGDDGKRSVYGLPVYNTYQEEVSFSTDEKLQLRSKGLTSYTHLTDNSVNNKKGRENYYSKEMTPPYATSYLLTAILSPDYVDVKKDGVTDDDLGTAVKFNYSKLDPLYNWRTPFAFGPDSANYNEGFLSDALDDKANYAYGQKEIWYMHSIESKTMVAHFITEDRDDALGVTDSRGGVNTAERLKRLKEIRLYSKSDLQLNGNDPSKTIPIKTVHFVYDNSICRGLPNSISNGGKLTLKKVFFTFGVNSKGKLNPYEFQYDTSYNHYDYRQYDRWGNFKDVANNPSGLNNSEFPYTIQDSALASQFASAWQLKKIILPSGGSINITYESDDYAYVQNKRASQMCLVNGVGLQGHANGLISADHIFINLPQPVYSQKEMLEKYFEGVDNLYFKFLLDLDNMKHKEFVPGYAKISGKPELIGNNIARIRLEKMKGVNPIAKAGWQFLRNNLPKYAYPGSENIESQDADLKKVIKALVAAFGSITELFRGFEKRAEKRHYSDKVDLGKSWVRLCSPSKKKLGGGSRVKRIDITDDWANMSGTSGATTATYSQVYDYTTKDEKKKTISSGVTSYEPTLGNDENPFRQPVRYKQNQFLSLDNYYYIEEPFGESFFPAASVGYSKVTVRTVGSGDAETVNRTGTVVSEYFTAKDYPTTINILGLEHRKPVISKLFKLIGGVSLDMVGLSQGYAIELNDMHGKPKSIHVYNKSDAKISSVEYFYKAVNELAEKKELRNDVKVINPDGTVSDGTIGMDVEMYTDMRQQTTDNLGISVKVSGGSGAILFFPLPFFFPGIGVNYDRRSFRSSSSIKIINRFAIQYKVKKTENGSSITSENLLWDAQTGNILLTKTQNEFEDPIYSFAYPAHWNYDGMAQAYKNLGTVLTGFSTGTTGQVSNATYDELLVPGDELIDVNSENKYWIISSPVTNNYQKRLIDASGNIQQVNDLTVKLLRSGRRNMANTAIATIASLNNPIAGDNLDVTVLTKVLDAKAIVFNEQWSVPQKIECANLYNCADGCSLSSDSTYCYKVNYRTPLDSIRTNITGSFCKYGHPAYAAEGTYIYDSSYQSNGTGGNPALIDADHLFWRNYMGDSDGPLNRAGVWLCDSLTSGRPYDTFIGFTVFLNVPVSKTYYIGISADNYVRLTVNNTIRFQTLNNLYTFSNWHILPVQLNAGVNSIRLEGNNDGGPAVFGAEVYNNTAAEISNANSYDDLNLIFSTNDIVGRNFQADATYAFSCPQGYSLDSSGQVWQCKQLVLCSSPGLGINNTINPYAKGLLGNWRVKSQYVYQVNRENIPGDNTKSGSTNIRKSGAYSVFNPFWTYNGYSGWDQNPTGDNRWIAANEVTYFNSKGMELENKDALDRYSAALNGYLESMPIAVASNTRYRELAYDGFEDYGFSLDCSPVADSCNPGHFSFKTILNGNSVDTTSLYSHSGKYSLKLNGAISIKKTVYMELPGPLFNFDNSGRYLLGSNELAKGFSPIPGKKYVLSFWVKDASPRNPSTSVQASINGAALIDGLSKWPIVEGWKRIEVPFLLSSSATSFNLQLQSGGGDVYIDDIRLHPFDGQMKSFAYDPSSQRLMAELDENNFAAFYEYDDEGTLIRVKKETERGIMTIKETRSGYRKR